MKKVWAVVLPLLLLVAGVFLFTSFQLGKSKFEVDCSKMYIGRASSGVYVHIAFFPGDYLYLRVSEEKNDKSTSDDVKAFGPIVYSVDNTLGYTRIVARLYGNGTGESNGDNPSTGLTITNCTKESITVSLSTVVYEQETFVCYAEENVFFR